MALFSQRREQSDRSQILQRGLEAGGMTKSDAGGAFKPTRSRTGAPRYPEQVQAQREGTMMQHRLNQDRREELRQRAAHALEMKDKRLDLRQKQNRTELQEMLTERRKDRLESDMPMGGGAGMEGLDSGGAIATRIGQIQSALDSGDLSDEQRNALETQKKRLEQMRQREQRQQQREDMKDFYETQEQKYDAIKSYYDAYGIDPSGGRGDGSGGGAAADRDYEEDMPWFITGRAQDNLPMAEGELVSKEEKTGKQKITTKGERFLEGMNWAVQEYPNATEEQAMAIAAKYSGVQSPLEQREARVEEINNTLQEKYGGTTQDEIDTLFTWGGPDKAQKLIKEREKLDKEIEQLQEQGVPRFQEINVPQPQRQQRGPLQRRGQRGGQQAARPQRGQSPLQTRQQRQQQQEEAQQRPEQGQRQPASEIQLPRYPEEAKKRTEKLRPSSDAEAEKKVDQLISRYGKQANQQNIKQTRQKAQKRQKQSTAAQHGPLTAASDVFRTGAEMLKDYGQDTASQWKGYWDVVNRMDWGKTNAWQFYNILHPNDRKDYWEWERDVYRGNTQWEKDVQGKAQKSK